MSAPLAYDGGYLKSTSGILKLCCLFCSFVGSLCIVCSAVQLRNFRGTFYLTVVGFSFCCSVCVLLARLFQLWQRKFYNFDAVRYETFLHGFLAGACFVAAIVALSLDVTAYTLAAFFGLLACSFYVYDAYLGHRLSHQSDAATQT